MNDAERDRLVDNIVGHLLDGVTEPVLQRAVEYFCNVDADLGERVEEGGARVSCARCGRMIRALPTRREK